MTPQPGHSGCFPPGKDPIKARTWPARRASQREGGYVLIYNTDMGHSGSHMEKELHNSLFFAIESTYIITARILLMFEDKLSDLPWYRLIIKFNYEIIEGKRIPACSNAVIFFFFFLT